MAKNSEGKVDLDGNTFNSALRKSGIVYFIDEYKSFFDENNADYYDKGKGLKNEHASFLDYKCGEVRIRRDLNFRGQLNEVDLWGDNPSLDMSTGKSARDFGYGSLDPLIHLHPNSSNGPSGADFKEAKLNNKIYDIIANQTQLVFYNKPGGFVLLKHNTFVNAKKQR